MYLTLWFKATILIVLVAESIQHDSAVLTNAPYNQFNIVDEHLKELRAVTAALLSTSERENDRCFVIITDDLHSTIYDHTFFRSVVKTSSSSSINFRSYFVLRVSNVDDRELQRLFGDVAWYQLHIRQCNLHFITISNGLQAKRLIRFIYRKRVLNVHAKFVILHDSRLLEQDMWHIWCNMLSSIFLQQIDNNRVRISGIPFPNILNGIVITKTLQKWHLGNRLQLETLFASHTNLNNLQGIYLPVVIYEHLPMVMRGDKAATNSKYFSNAFDDNNTHYFGVEVEIMRTLGAALNFRPVFYMPSVANGSYASLLAELLNYKAIFAIGDLHPYEMHRNHIDLSWPHTIECLTFLTPESSRDENWRTLLQPFSITMWACVFLSFALVGTIFYIIAFLNNRAQQYDEHSTMHKRAFFRCVRRKLHWLELHHGDVRRHIYLRMYLNRRPRQLQQDQRADMFDKYSNCILLTYSMLLYVALPGMPRDWPLRVLTGWFWVYCILVTVTYRASLTAILANPAARITIDSLEDLKRSHVIATVSLAEDKQLFDDAIDDLARVIGQRIEIISDIYSVTERIAKENFAYYDNMYFLRHLRLDDDTSRDGEEVLHIMHECVINVPVTIGMVKNSVLKARVDVLLNRLSESGLLNKWLIDVTQNLNAVEKSPQEAVMNLSKIWSSFVALAVGLLLAVCAIIGEQLHYRYIVCKHPLYDEYNRNFYYNFRYHMRNTSNSQFRI